MNYIILLIIYMGLYIWFWMMFRPLEIRTAKVKFLVVPGFIMIGSVVIERIAGLLISIGASFLIGVMGNSPILYTCVVGFIYAVIMVVIRCLTVRLLARLLVNIKMSIWVWVINVLVVILYVIFGIEEFFYFQRMMSEISQNNYANFIRISTTPNSYAILNRILIFVVPIVTGADVLLHMSKIRRKAL